MSFYFSDIDFFHRAATFDAIATLVDNRNVISWFCGAFATAFAYSPAHKTHHAR